MIRIKPILRNPHNDKQADTLLDALIGAPPAEAGARSFREDLPRLSSAALYRELIVLCLRMALAPRPRRWWAERYHRIAEELHLRGIHVELGGGSQ